MHQQILVLACLAVSAPAGAATMIFQQGASPTGAYEHLGHDIRSNAPSNTGSDLTIGAQIGGVGSIRGVLGFDLNALPAGAQITGINLLMTVNNGGTGTISGQGTIELHEVVPNGVAANNMVENQVSFANWQTGSAWTTAGGDFGPTLTAGTVADTNTNNAFNNGEQAAFPSSAAWVMAAQNAFDAGLPLEMILFAPAAESASLSHFARFGSDDAATIANRPLLTVQYIPEPATSGLLCVGALGLLRRRRQRAG